MEWLLAVGLLGVIVVFGLPFLSDLIKPYLPPSLASNILGKVLITGGILFVLFYLAHKAGLGKYLREAS